MGADGIAVSPGLVINVVFVVVSVTAVHPFGSVEQSLIELCFPGVGDALCRHTKRYLFTNVAFSLALQTRTFVWCCASQIPFASTILVPLLAQLITFTSFFGFV